MEHSNTAMEASDFRVQRQSNETSAPVVVQLHKMENNEKLSKVLKLPCRYHYQYKITKTYLVAMIVAAFHQIKQVMNNLLLR